jgi:hypothetical protein
MSVRSSACLAAAALLGATLVTPSAAETFIVNGVLFQSVEGLDRTILAYGENYPPPTPTHAVAPRHSNAAGVRRSAAVVFYHPPCLFWDGQATAAVSCRMAPYFVGEALSYGFR